jgi:DNA-binding response OmpR family regulator
MIKILIVDGDPTMLKAIKTILLKEKYVVTSAKNGKEAIEFLNKEIYDLLITELILPYNNGLEIISYIKHNNIDIKIIVVSSINSEEMIIEAFNLGANEYLKKPIMVGELLVRIKKMLDNKQIKISL